jgi:hypothetical protein
MDSRDYEVTITPVRNGFIVNCQIDRDYENKEVYIERTTEDVGKRAAGFLEMQMLEFEVKEENE